ncbi:unnamed protein product, partial [Adineta ricciae]
AFSLVIYDFNKDNRLDILITNNGTNNIGLFFGYDPGAFQKSIQYSTDFRPLSIALADLNNDNYLDFVTANYGPNTIGIFYGLSNGTFNKQIIYSTGLSSGPNAVNSDDLDNDNYIDIVVANSILNNIGIFFNHGNGTFNKQITFSTGFYSRPYSLVVNDLNNDGILGIITANRHSDTIDILIGFGDRSFANVLTYKTGSYYTPYSINIGNFNNHNQSDIVVANRDVNKISIFLGFGNGTFANLTTYLTGSIPCSTPIDYLNNDQYLDIVISNSNSNNISIVFGYSDGTFTKQITCSTGINSNPYCSYK